MDCKGTQKIWKHNIYEIFFALFCSFFRRSQFFILMRFSKLFVLFIIKNTNRWYSAFYDLWSSGKVFLFVFWHNCYFCQTCFSAKRAQNSELAQKRRQVLSIFAGSEFFRDRPQKRAEIGAIFGQKRLLSRGCFRGCRHPSTTLGKSPSPTAHNHPEQPLFFRLILNSKS